MSAVARLILVRHGESEGNRDRIFTQSPDVPLTPVGVQQAHAAAAQIRERFQASRVICSPYTRARQTAQIIAGALALAIEEEPDLCEQSFGIFAGKPYESLLTDAAYHEGPRWAWRPQGGESLLDVCGRVVPAMQRIAQSSAGQDVVVVSHGGVMLAICAHVSGSWHGLSVTPNAGLVVVEFRDGNCSLVNCDAG